MDPGQQDNHSPFSSQLETSSENTSVNHVSSEHQGATILATEKNNNVHPSSPYRKRKNGNGDHKAFATSSCPSTSSSAYSTSMPSLLSSRASSSFVEADLEPRPQSLTSETDITPVPRRSSRLAISPRGQAKDRTASVRGVAELDDADDGSDLVSKNLHRVANKRRPKRARSTVVSSTTILAKTTLTASGTKTGSVPVVTSKQVKTSSSSKVADFQMILGLRLVEEDGTEEEQTKAKPRHHTRAKTSVLTETGRGSTRGKASRWTEQEDNALFQGVSSFLASKGLQTRLPQDQPTVPSSANRSLDTSAESPLIFHRSPSSTPLSIVSSWTPSLPPSVVALPQSLYLRDATHDAPKSDFFGTDGNSRSQVVVNSSTSDGYSISSFASLSTEAKSTLKSQIDPVFSLTNPERVKNRDGEIEDTEDDAHNAITYLFDQYVDSSSSTHSISYESTSSRALRSIYPSSPLISSLQPDTSPTHIEKYQESYQRMTTPVPTTISDSEQWHFYHNLTNASISGHNATGANGFRHDGCSMALAAPIALPVPLMHMTDNPSSTPDAGFGSQYTERFFRVTPDSARQYTVQGNRGMCQLLRAPVYDITLTSREALVRENVISTSMVFSSSSSPSFSAPNRRSVGDERDMMCGFTLPKGYASPVASIDPANSLSSSVSFGSDLSPMSPSSAFSAGNFESNGSDADNIHSYQQHYAQSMSKFSITDTKNTAHFNITQLRKGNASVHLDDGPQDGYQTQESYALAISRAMSQCPWTSIVRSSPTLAGSRTGVQAQARWSEALDPQVQKGPWSQEEDILLMDGVGTFAKCWIAIADQIPGRTQRQCRTRWVQLQTRVERERLLVSTPINQEGAQIKRKEPK